MASRQESLHGQEGNQYAHDVGDDCSQDVRTQDESGPIGALVNIGQILKINSAAGEWVQTPSWSQTK
jgi:hypothetical protein